MMFIINLSSTLASSKEALAVDDFGENLSNQWGEETLDDYQQMAHIFCSKGLSPYPFFCFLVSRWRASMKKSERKMDRET